MTHQYVMGVDPGKSGAVAVLDPKTLTLIDLFDMPIYKDNKGKRHLDCYALSLGIDKWAKSTRYAVLEDVFSRPGQSSQSTFSLGESKGVIRGILASFMIATYLPSPAVWKTLMKLSPDKRKSLDMAIKLFPQSAHYFKRVKDHDRAEAALLAYFGLRFDTEGPPPC